MTLEVKTLARQVVRSRKAVARLERLDLTISMALTTPGGGAVWLMPAHLSLTGQSVRCLQ